MSFSSTTHPLNYVTANRFYIEIESTLTACFSECSGVSVKVKAEKQHEGGVNEQQRVFLGQAEFDDISLKRGVTNDQMFLSWIRSIMVPRSVGTAAHVRRTIHLVTFNQAGETMQRWTLIGAVPVSWKAGSFQANGTSVVIEELTLSYEGLLVPASAGSASGATLLTGGRGSDGYFGSSYS